MTNPKTSRLIPGKLYRIDPSWKGSSGVVRLFRAKNHGLGPLVDRNCVILYIRAELSGVLVLYGDSLYWMHSDFVGKELAP